MATIIEIIETHDMPNTDKEKDTNYIYTLSDKQMIIKNIKELSKIEHIEIFKILKNKNIKYSENSNGIFVNFNNIPNNIIGELYNFIKFCLKNKEELKKNEEFILQNKSIIENSIETNNIRKCHSPSTSDDENDNEIIIPDDIITMDGTKINLKKDKPVYKGIKAKIMKNYKQK